MINNSKKIKINKVSNMSKMSGNRSITSMMFLFLEFASISKIMRLNFEALFPGLFEYKRHFNGHAPPDANDSKL